MPNIYFEKVGLEDLQKLKKLAHKTFYDSFAYLNSEKNMRLYSNYAFTDETVSGEINDSKTSFYFANSGSQTLGYFKIREESKYKEDEIANGMQLERIYVLAEHQGQRIGQFILEEVIALARKSKADFLWLGVWDQNVRAVKFYERNGFVLDGKIAFQLGEEEQWDYLMKLVF